MPKSRHKSEEKDPLLGDVSSELSLYIPDVSKKRKSSKRKGGVEALPLLEHDLTSEIQSLQRMDAERSASISQDGMSAHIPVKDFDKLLNPKSSETAKPKPQGFFGKMMPWAMSKGVIKAVNIIVPVVAFSGVTALSGGIVPAVALGIASTTIIFNSIRDTNSLRALKELEQEHILLQEYHLSKNIEKAANKLIQDKTGVDLVGPDDLVVKKAKHEFQSQYENNLTSRSLGKTIRDGIFEAMGNIATVAVVATSGLANAASHAISVGSVAGVLTVADIISTTANRRKMNIIKNGMRNNIDVLHDVVPEYKSIAELQIITRAQQIKSTAMMQLSGADVSHMDEASLRQGLDLLQVGASAKFEVPIKPTFWQRTKQYFKDFNEVNWPNDYYTSARFANKLNRDTGDLVDWYDMISRDVHKISKDRDIAKVQGYNAEVARGRNVGKHGEERNVAG